jgi:hypothetical protein
VGKRGLFAVAGLRRDASDRFGSIVGHDLFCSSKELSQQDERATRLDAINFRSRPRLLAGRFVPFARFKVDVREREDEAAR